MLFRSRCVEIPEYRASAWPNGFEPARKQSFPQIVLCCNGEVFPPPPPCRGPNQVPNLKEQLTPQQGFDVNLRDYIMDFAAPNRLLLSANQSLRDCASYSGSEFIDGGSMGSVNLTLVGEDPGCNETQKHDDQAQEELLVGIGTDLTTNAFAIRDLSGGRPLVAACTQLATNLRLCKAGKNSARAVKLTSYNACRPLEWIPRVCSLNE